MNQTSASRSARSRSTTSAVNPYAKRAIEGKSEHEATIGQKNSKSKYDRVNGMVENFSTPPSKSNSMNEYSNVVTNTSVVYGDNNDNSNKYNKSSHQSTKDGLTIINTKLHFNNDKQNATAMSKMIPSISTDTSSTSSLRTKSELYNIDWCNSKQVIIEGRKYKSHKTAVINQEESINLIINDSTTAKIKSAFMLLIGQNGVTSAEVFLPLPTQRAKLIENFLILVYNMKSIMVDNKKHEYR